MSREGRTALEGGIREVDGCDEERWRGSPAAAQVGSDVGSFSLKVCHAVSCGGVVRARVGCRCPHLRRLSHWHRSGRWGRRRERGTMRG